MRGDFSTLRISRDGLAMFPVPPLASLEDCCPSCVAQRPKRITLVCNASGTLPQHKIESFKAEGERLWHLPQQISACTLPSSLLTAAMQVMQSCMLVRKLGRAAG